MSRSRRPRLALPLCSLLLALVCPSSLLVHGQAQPTPCFRWSGQMAIAASPDNTSATSSLWYYVSLARQLSTALASCELLD